MRTRTRVTIGGFVAAAAVVAAIAVTSTEVKPAGVFYSVCGYDHSAPDDPIVFPGQPGASHLHDFFGVQGIDASTQPEQKVDQPTRCEDPGDTAGYWTPALLVDGQPLQPSFVNARYSAGGKAGNTLQAFPPGLKVVAGPGPKVTEWSCKPGKVPDAPLGCSDRSWGTARIDFPDCWNGTDLDSPDHRSHMTYAQKVKGAQLLQCPASHPIPVVSLTVKVQYAKPMPDGTTAELSSGTLPTIHADFMNSWNQDRLEELVQNCIRTHIAPGKQCKKAEADSL